MRRVSSEEIVVPEELPAEVTEPAPPHAERHRMYRRKRWTKIEKEIRAQYGPLIAGVDEVGRGPLAVPLCPAAFTILPALRTSRGAENPTPSTVDHRRTRTVKFRQ